MLIFIIIFLYKSLKMPKEISYINDRISPMFSGFQLNFILTALRD